MDLMKLQNLLNECIMIEQGNYLGGNFSVDLKEAQVELDQAKQLLLHDVSKSFYCYKEDMTRTEAVNYLKELCSNHVNTQVLDECVGRLNELGWFSEKDKRGNVKFINTFTKANVKNHFNNVLYTYE